MSDLTSGQNVGDKSADFSVATGNELAADDADAEPATPFAALFLRVERQQNLVRRQTRMLLLLLLQLLISRRNQLGRGRRAVRKET